MLRTGDYLRGKKRSAVRISWESSFGSIAVYLLSPIVVVWRVWNKTIFVWVIIAAAGTLLCGLCAIPWKKAHPCTDE